MEELDSQTAFFEILLLDEIEISDSLNEKEPSDEDGAQTSSFQFIGVTLTNILSLRRAVAVIAPGFPVTVTIPFALGAETSIRDTTGASSRSRNICSLSRPIHSLERSVMDPARLRGIDGVGSGVCVGVEVCVGMAVCVGLGVTEGIGLGVAA